MSVFSTFVNSTSRVLLNRGAISCEWVVEKIGKGNYYVSLEANFKDGDAMIDAVKAGIKEVDGNSVYFGPLLVVNGVNKGVKKYHFEKDKCNGAIVNALDNTDFTNNPQRFVIDKNNVTDESFEFTEDISKFPKPFGQEIKPKKYDIVEDISKFPKPFPNR